MKIFVYLLLFDIVLIDLYSCNIASNHTSSPLLWLRRDIRAIYGYK